MYGVDNFDVIIGNPPYIKEYTNKDAFDGIRGEKYYQGKMDIWYYFACHLLDMLPKDGNLAFIATNNWVTNSGASKFRNKIAEDGKIIQLIDFGNTKVFSSAGIQTMILIAEKDCADDDYEFEYKKIDSDSATLADSFNMLKGLESPKYTIARPTFNRSEFLDKSFLFNSSEKDLLLDIIKSKQNFKLDAKKEVAQGIVPPQDFLNKKNQQILGKGHKIGEGIFILNEDELNNLGLTNHELDLIKPFYSTNRLNRFYGNQENKNWIIYTDSSFKYSKNIKSYPNIKNHLDKYSEIITSSNRPYGLHRARIENFFLGEKIISLRKCSDRPTFTFTEFDCYVSQTHFVIKTNRINQKYLTALLNSSLIEFWLRYRGKMQGFNFQVDKEPLLDIPIFNPESTEIFSILVDYIIQVKRLEKEQINSHVPNSHLAEQFEEIIDAMVMELYFKQDFKNVGIEFIKYVERDFKPIEHLKNHDEKIKVIHETYQKLRQKDNEIRNNLKLMDIKLADIVMPIKTAK